MLNIKSGFGTDRYGSQLRTKRGAVEASKAWGSWSPQQETWAKLRAEGLAAPNLLCMAMTHLVNCAD